MDRVKTMLLTVIIILQLVFIFLSLLANYLSEVILRTKPNYIRIIPLFLIGFIDGFIIGGLLFLLDF